MFEAAAIAPQVFRASILLRRRRQSVSKETLFARRPTQTAPRNSPRRPRTSHACRGRSMRRSSSAVNSRTVRLRERGRLPIDVSQVILAGGRAAKRDPGQRWRVDAIRRRSRQQVESSPTAPAWEPRCLRRALATAAGSEKPTEARVTIQTGIKRVAPPREQLLNSLPAAA